MQATESAKELKRLLAVGRYQATKRECDGFQFDSELEFDTYTFLRAIHDAGGMANLKLQVLYKLHGVDGSVVCKYILDFLCELSNGLTYAVESKGKMTREASIKLKLFRAEYGKQTPLVVIRDKNLHQLRDVQNEVLCSVPKEREACFRFWMREMK